MTSNTKDHSFKRYCIQWNKWPSNCTCFFIAIFGLCILDIQQFENRWIIGQNTSSCKPASAWSAERGRKRRPKYLTQSDQRNVIHLSAFQHDLVSYYSIKRGTFATTLPVIKDTMIAHNKMHQGDICDIKESSDQARQQRYACAHHMEGDMMKSVKQQPDVDTVLDTWAIHWTLSAPENVKAKVQQGNVTWPW